MKKRLKKLFQSRFHCFKFFLKNYSIPKKTFIKYFWKILGSKNLNKTQMPIQNHTISNGFAKIFILDVWQGSEYAIEIYWTDVQKTLKTIPENLFHAFKKSLKVMKTARRTRPSLYSPNFNLKGRHYFWSEYYYMYRLQYYMNLC